MPFFGSIATRQRKTSSLPPYVITAETLEERVTWALKPDSDNPHICTLMVHISGCEWCPNPNIDNKLELVACSKQARFRTADDRATNRPFNTGSVRGYYGHDLCTIDTPLGPVEAQLKVEFGGFRPRSPKRNHSP